MHNDGDVIMHQQLHPTCEADTNRKISRESTTLVVKVVMVLLLRHWMTSLLHDK